MVRTGTGEPVMVRTGTGTGYRCPLQRQLQRQRPAATEWPHPPSRCRWLASRRSWRSRRASRRTFSSDRAFVLPLPARGVWQASLPRILQFARSIKPPDRHAAPTMAGILMPMGGTGFATSETWPTATPSAMRCRGATSSPSPQRIRAMRASSIKAAPRECLRRVVTTQPTSVIGSCRRSTAASSSRPHRHGAAPRATALQTAGPL